MTDPIDPFAITDDKDYLTELVGEGKQYADPKALAKAAFNKQKHIETLEAELAVARTQSANGMNVETLLEEIRKLNQGNPGEGNRPPVVADPANPPIAIEDAILNTLEKHEQAKRIKENKQIAVSKMNEVWGADSGKELQRAANELGVSVDYLQGVAQQSPSAFFALTGLNTSRSAPSGTSVPTSTVKMPDGSSKVRNSSYYRELRRTNPALYRTKEVLVQEQRDALNLGEAFFN